jgi:hypothetical protein
VVEGAVPAAAVFVGAVADMVGLGRETLTPESFITMAGRFVQIRIRERRGLDFSARRARKKNHTGPVRRGAGDWATEKLDMMAGSFGGRRARFVTFGGGRGREVDRESC